MSNGICGRVGGCAEPVGGIPTANGALCGETNASLAERAAKVLVHVGGIRVPYSFGRFREGEWLGDLVVAERRWRPPGAGASRTLDQGVDCAAVSLVVQLEQHLAHELAESVGGQCGQRRVDVVACGFGRRGSSSHRDDSEPLSSSFTLAASRSARSAASRSRASSARSSSSVGRYIW